MQGSPQPVSERKRTDGQHRSLQSAGWAAGAARRQYRVRGERTVRACAKLGTNLRRQTAESTQGHQSKDARARSPLSLKRTGAPIDTRFEPVAESSESRT